MKNQFKFPSVVLLGFLLLATSIISCKTETDSTETEPTYYTVSFDSDGGTEVASQSVKGGKTAAKPVTPTKDGYAFTAWYKGETEYDFSTPVTSNITLAAHWSKNTVYYTVTYKSDYGTISDALKNGILLAENTILTDEQLPALSDDKAIFKGWYDGETKAVASEYAVTKNVTLTALWMDEATVSYASVFCTVPTSFMAKLNQTLTAENLASLDCPPYTFLGWFYAKDESGNGTGLQAQVGEKITADTTLYAKWQTATISFETQFGEVSSVIKYTGEKIAESEIATLSETGYTFGGWFRESTQLTSDCTVTDNVTFTAKWTANIYTVTFNANGGTPETAIQALSFGETEKLKTNTFSYTGYRFSSWNTAQDGSGLSYSDGGDFSVTETNDITLYAQWIEVDRFVITYANTRDAVNESPTSYRETLGATLSDLNLTGYIFDGWYSELDASGNGTGTKITSWGANEKSGDITLYAKWSPRTDTAYTVEHYKENADDNGFTKVEDDTENLTGTTDGATSATAKSYENFKAEPVTQGTVAADGSTVVKVYYKRVTVTMTLVFDGGTIGGETGATFTGKYGSRYAVVGTPRKVGYRFSEWNPKLPATLENGSHTATWTANTYTVTFKANGGNGVDITQEIAFETSAVLLENTFIRDGYNFAGWNTNAKGNGTTYADEELFTMSEARNITLYAQWSAVNGIAVTIAENSDIEVTRKLSNNILTFTATEEYDSYRWFFDNAEISTTQICTIDTSPLAKGNGTYTIALEAQKDGMWYSYFAQIRVTN